MGNLQKIVYLTKAQAEELFANGTITVGGITVTYSQDDLYVTDSGDVTDVQVNGTSIVQNGIANIPIGLGNNPGVLRVTNGGSSTGLSVQPDGRISVYPAQTAAIKQGNTGYAPILGGNQHLSTFYGLAKVAGHDEKDSSLEAGVYTPEAKGSIQSMLGVTDLIGTDESSLVASKAYAVGEVFVANGKMYVATSAIAANDAIVPYEDGISAYNCIETNLSEKFPHDVQVNGTSVVTNGVANIPAATDGGLLGAVKVDSTFGVGSNSSGRLYLAKASEAQIKAGTSDYKSCVPSNQHQSAFYGLAKAAGDTTQSSSSNAVGTYTPEAKNAIQSMLGVEPGVSFVEEITGTTATITGEANVRYVCGELTELTITPPSNGTMVVRFTSGTTPTVLSIPNTVKFPDWVDLSTLEASTTYEIMITDGVYGGVMTWAG